MRIRTGLVAITLLLGACYTVNGIEAAYPDEATFVAAGGSATYVPSTAYDIQTVEDYESSAYWGACRYQAFEKREDWVLIPRDRFREVHVDPPPGRKKWFEARLLGTSSLQKLSQQPEWLLYVTTSSRHALIAIDSTRKRCWFHQGRSPVLPPEGAQ